MTVCPVRFCKTLKRKDAYLHDCRTFEEVVAYSVDRRPGHWLVSVSGGL